MKLLAQKKIALFSVLFLLLQFCSYAQDDYVLTEAPKDDKKETPSRFNRVDNPDYTNYFLTATAFTLKKKDIRLSGTNAFFMKGSYGLTDNLMASVNFSFLGSITASLKYQVNLTEDLKLGFSGGGGLLTITSPDSMMFIGGGQTMITYGSHSNNITLGVGYYHVKSTYSIDGATDELPLYKVYAGIEKQIGRKLFLLADIIYFPDHNLITGGIGGKILFSDFMSFVVGVTPITQEHQYVNNTQIRQSYVLPFVSFRMILD